MTALLAWLWPYLAAIGAAIAALAVSADDRAVVTGAWLIGLMDAGCG